MTWKRLLGQSMAVSEGRKGKERVAKGNLFFHLKLQDTSVSFLLTVLSTTNVMPIINDTPNTSLHHWCVSRFAVKLFASFSNRVEDLQQTDWNHLFKKSCLTVRWICILNFEVCHPCSHFSLSQNFVLFWHSKRKFFIIRTFSYNAITNWEYGNI